MALPSFGAAARILNPNPLEETMATKTETVSPGIVNRDNEGGCRIARFFDSIETIGKVKPSKQGEPKARECALYARYGSRDDASWAGGLAHLEDWTAKAAKGWKEGVTRLRKSLKSLKPVRAKSIRRRRRWKDQGEELDIHRVYSGNLDLAWRGFEKREATGSPILNVWIEASAGANRSADSLFWRGAAATAMVESLEESGYRCNVYVYSFTRNLYDSDFAKKDSFFAFCAKESNMPFDIERFALLTSHPSTLRTAFFSIYCSLPYKPRWSFGQPIHDKPVPFAQEGDITVKNVWDAADAQALIDETMSRFA